VLNSYRRTRLFKMQTWFLHLAADAPARRASDRLLSDAEREFLARFRDLRLQHLGAAVLRRLPEGYQNLGGGIAMAGGGAGGAGGAGGGTEEAPSTELLGEEAVAARQMREGPSRHKHVLVHVLDAELGPQQLPGQTSEVDLQAGATFLTSFASIEALLLAGKVECR
jgi:hypothetical protein